MIESMTIYSLSTGAGMAGIAVIRVSGPKAFQSIDLLCSLDVEERYASLRKIKDPISGEVLDEGLVLKFQAPLTFTGEDIVEFHIHGGRATISAVLDVLGRIDDFRQAEAGEFTRRAFSNGRLDLVEIEGLGDLLHAQTQAQRKQALAQAQGASSLVFEKWRKDVISILAYFEASIDFVEEEDVDERAVVHQTEKMIHLRNEMSGHLNDSARGTGIRDGVKVVLVGEPNVGKSSILNYLANREVAIVSEIPGTTRDAIEVQLELNGIPVIFTDTAGLRQQTDDLIEKEGIKRTHQKSLEADIVLWVIESGQYFNKLDVVTEADVIKVINKIDDVDQSLGEIGPALKTSVKTGHGLDILLKELSDKVSELFGGNEPALITRQRQKEVLSHCIGYIDRAIEMDSQSLELLSEQIRLAAIELGRLVGRVDVEDLLDVIFNDFCVGK